MKEKIIPGRSLRLPFAGSLQDFIAESSKHSVYNGKIQQRLLWMNERVFDALGNEIGHKISRESRQMFGFTNGIGDWTTYFYPHRYGFLTVGFPEEDHVSLLTRTSKDGIATIYVGYSQRKMLRMEPLDVKLAGVVEGHIIAAHYRKESAEDIFELLSTNVGVNPQEITSAVPAEFAAVATYLMDNRHVISAYITEAMAKKTGQRNIIHLDNYGAKRGFGFFADEFATDDRNRVLKKIQQAKLYGFKVDRTPEYLKLSFDPAQAENDKVDQQTSSWEIKIPLTI